MCYMEVWMDHCYLFNILLIHRIICFLFSWMWRHPPFCDRHAGENVGPSKDSREKGTNNLLRRATPIQLRTLAIVLITVVTWPVIIISFSPSGCVPGEGPSVSIMQKRDRLRDGPIFSRQVIWLAQLNIRKKLIQCITFFSLEDQQSRIGFFCAERRHVKLVSSGISICSTAARESCVRLRVFHASDGWKSRRLERRPAAALTNRWRDRKQAASEENLPLDKSREAHYHPKTKEKSFSLHPPKEIRNLGGESATCGAVFKLFN